MAYRLSDYPDLFTKRSVAKQVFPHLPSRYGWKKIRMAVGDDPVLHAAFIQHRRYLYLSEYKYLMNILMINRDLLKRQVIYNGNQ